MPNSRPSLARWVAPERRTTSSLTSSSSSSSSSSHQQQQQQQLVLFQGPLLYVLGNITTGFQLCCVRACEH